MKKDTIFKRLYHGILLENPTVVLCLGLCPTLAVSTTAKNGLAMGIVTAVVLILSEFVISLMKRIISPKDRMIIYVLVAACFTTLVQIVLDAYFPEISESLGIFVSLTAVNGLIFGRADGYALKKNPFLSIFDGIGFGIGFTLIITILGAIREIIGLGTIFGIRIIPAGCTLSIAAMAPGAFFLLACLIAVANKIRGGRRA
ncbi:MAG: electron transport complex subunit RsxE [Parasporobacterium sp.]|nr:electron transport complex subunit RsxE [Parasporobacterium sp.]